MRILRLSSFVCVCFFSIRAHLLIFVNPDRPWLWSAKIKGQELSVKMICRILVIGYNVSVGTFLKGKAMREADKNSQESKAKVSKLAVGAFGLAIAGIVTAFFTAPFALILGILSVFRIQKSKGKLKGTSVAIAAIIIAEAGAIWLVCVGIPRIRCISPRMTCGTNLSNLGKAMLVYANEYNGKYPTADKWCDLLIAEGLVNERQLKCPAIKDKRVRCSYAINPNCHVDSPPDTVLLFETDGGWNQFGGVELLTLKNHKEDIGFNVLYSDLHVAFTFEPLKAVLDLNWGNDPNQ